MQYKDLSETTGSESPTCARVKTNGNIDSWQAMKDYISWIQGNDTNAAPRFEPGRWLSGKRPDR